MTFTKQFTNDPVDRAFAAWFRSNDGGATRPVPDPALSGIEEVDDKRYVVLRDHTGLLAIYRITNVGQLKRLKRWPAEFDER